RSDADGGYGNAELFRDLTLQPRQVLPCESFKTLRPPAVEDGRGGLPREPPDHGPDKDAGPRAIPWRAPDGRWEIRPVRGKALVPDRCCAEQCVGAVGSRDTVVFAEAARVLALEPRNERRVTIAFPSILQRLDEVRSPIGEAVDGGNPRKRFDC